MAIQQLVVVLCIAAVLVTGLRNSSKHDQSEIFGVQGPDDKLLYSEDIDLGFLYFENKDSFEPTFAKNVTYPQPPATEGVNLTCIKVLDNMKGGHNAVFFIKEGGVNQSHAQLNFNALGAGYTIMYSVEFYGKP